MATANRTVQDLTSSGSLLKQIECPSQAVGPYAPFTGLGFMLGTAFPEMIGYMFAYNFSGLGSNDGDFWGKMGFMDLHDSKRILGYNYFQPMNSPSTAQKDQVKCSETSGACAGKAPFLYIRGYPTSNSGNLSFAIFEDVLDLNPAMLIQAMFSAVEPGGPKCEQITMPVGSNFNFCMKQADYQPPKDGETTPPVIPGAQLGYQEAMQGGNAGAITQHIEKCENYCVQMYGADPMPFKRDNCVKDCSRIWWEETRCALKPLYTETVSYPKCDASGSVASHTSYDIPIGKDNSKSAQGKNSSSVDISKQVGNPNGASTDSFQNYTPSQMQVLTKMKYQRVGYFIILACLFASIIILCVCKYYFGNGVSL